MRVIERKEKRRRARVRVRLPPLDGECLVIPVFLGAEDVDVGVNPSLRHGEDGGWDLDSIQQQQQQQQQAMDLFDHDS